MLLDRAERHRLLREKATAIARKRLDQAAQRIEAGDATLIQGEDLEWLTSLEEALSKRSAALVSAARAKSLPPGEKLSSSDLRDRILGYYRGLLKVCASQIDDLVRDQLGLDAEAAISFASLPLLQVPTEALLYGARPGGAAMTAMLAAGGPAMMAAFKAELAKSPPKVGDFILTDAFALSTFGVKSVVHVIATEAAPDKLIDGMVRGMRDVLARFSSSITIALPGLEAGVPAPDAARSVLRAIATFGAEAGLDFHVALPSRQEREAMSAARRR